MSVTAMIEALRARSRRPIMAVLSRPRLATVFGAVLIGLPAVTAIIRLAGRNWFPTGDFSQTELMVRSIPQHPPLVGVAARVGDGLLDQGSTPGPSMAYLLYPIYLLGGRSSISLVSGVVILHLVAVAFSLYVTWFLGGWRATWAMGLGFSLLVRALSPSFFLEPWNVWIPLLAFALFILLIWGVLLGHRWMFLAAVVVGTHCVQTHVSYIPLVVGLLLIAGIVLVRNSLNKREGDDWWLLVASAGALTVMWLPPIIEQITTSPGNLTRLWRHFANPTESTVGIAAAARAFAGEFNLVGPFVVGPGHLPTESPNYWGMLGFVVMVVVGLVSARRSGDRRIQTLQVVLGVTTIIGFVATSRIFGIFYEYVIRWMWVLATLWLVVSIWAVVSAHLDTGARRSVMILGCVVSAVLLSTSSLASASPPLERDSQIVGDLADQLERSLDPSQAYLLRWHDPAALGGTGFGLILAMEKRGFPLYVDGWAGVAAQKHRVRDVSETDAVLCLESGPENIERFASRDNVQLVAAADPRNEAEVHESAELRSAIDDDLRRTGRLDLLDVLDTQYGQTRVLMDPDLSSRLHDLVQRYNDLRLPTAMFVAPRGSLCIP